MDWNASRAVFNFCLVWSSRKFSFLLNERRSAAAAAVVTETRLYSTLTATLWLQTYTRLQRGSCSTAQWPNISLQHYVFSNIVAHNSVKALWKHSYIFPHQYVGQAQCHNLCTFLFQKVGFWWGNHTAYHKKKIAEMLCVCLLYTTVEKGSETRPPSPPWKLMNGGS